MKRAFTLGMGPDRRLMVIEVGGARVGLLQKVGDGSTRRSVKTFGGEVEARAEFERMARDLLARGYTELPASGAVKAQPASASFSSMPAARSGEPIIRPDRVNVNFLLEADEPTTRAEGPVIPRISAPQTVGSAVESDSRPNKKARGKKHKRKQPESRDDLDKRVIAGVIGVGAICVLLLGIFVYDAFLKPSSIVGTWGGSMIDFEIGRPIIHTQYRLILDGKKNASLTLQEKFTSVGTYVVQGNLLRLSLKGEKDEEGEESLTTERQYRIALGRSTLDLFDPSSGKKMVQLIRFQEPPTVGDGPPAPAAPTDLAATSRPDAGEGSGDAAEGVNGGRGADLRLASVDFTPRDGAFRIRYPTGWKAETGSRPDNVYSWATFTHGSAKIQVNADVQGSLISGSDSVRQHEEGSELAPVHVAHEHHKKAVAEEYSDYKESAPALFTGSTLGEGRVAAFTASGGGLFGSTLRGYRVTLLTNDRRVTILCHCPADEFARLKPTFLAVCRSLAR